jgi:hypothetical protein
VDTVLHKHRTVQGNRRFSKFNLLFGTGGRDALGQHLVAGLFALLYRNTKTANEVSLAALNGQTDNRGVVFGQVYSEKVGKLHFQQAPNRLFLMFGSKSIFQSSPLSKQRLSAHNGDSFDSAAIFFQHNDDR